jgi:hypothetical protein
MFTINQHVNPFPDRTFPLFDPTKVANNATLESIDVNSTLTNSSIITGNENLSNLTNVSNVTTVINSNTSSP